MMMEDDIIINKEKNVQLRERMCEIKPTNQMEIDGGLFADTMCRNVGRKADEIR